MGLACVAGQTAAQTTPTKRVTIATYNINWGNIGLDEVEKAVRDASADVVCLQETNTQSERFLRRRLSSDYRHIQFVGHRNQFGAERFGYLSRLPLRGLNFDAPKHGLFGTYYATVLIDGVAVHIANVHLSPFVVRRGSSLPQALSAISRIETAHRDEINQILSNINPTVPTLVAGDFNSLSTFIAPMELTRREMTDSFAAVKESPDTHPTWHWRIRSGEIRFRIDYIFHSSHFRTVSSRIVETNGSDHFLVVSDLDFVPPDLQK
jgi:endonuclease/exonuclease/phosphatase family metal-dependent hydrolase